MYKVAILLIFIPRNSGLRFKSKSGKILTYRRHTLDFIWSTLQICLHLGGFRLKSKSAVECI
jgi:hypothetical protein